MGSIRRCIHGVMIAATFAFACAATAETPEPAAAEATAKPATKKKARKPVEHDGGHEKHATRKGVASYYAHDFKGKKTASGERYDPQALTAAHRTLPLGTQVKVTNPKNDRSVVVTVNDRGPVKKDRMIDLSGAAAQELGMTRSGVAKVETEVVKTPDPNADAKDAAAEVKR